MRTLFQDIRSEQNIFSAWRHVKRSASSSKNSDIRGMASEFEHSHQRYLRRIIDQLREGRFSFDPAEGILKDKKKRISQGKNPRPIVVSTLNNRIVQRAILQVLQPRESRNLRDAEEKYEVKIDNRLGRINDVNRSRYGVGGLIYPYGGVRPAITLITRAIDNGAKFYYQSDIKSFFTKIPTARVVDFVRSETNDKGLVEIFEQALQVHLRNPEELMGYADLFPSNGLGVAQGSSLSAFAGNVLLFEMDHELNGMGVHAVRYIDDILIVAESEIFLENAVRRSEEILTGFGFGLYTPSDGADKAAKGECSSAINFLGCTIQPRRCVPSASSINRMKEIARNSLAESRSAIKKLVEGGADFDANKSQSATLDKLGRQIYGWQKSFSFCNQEQPFRHLDAHIASHINSYHEFVVRKLRGVDPAIKARALGIQQTHQMPLDPIVG